MLRSVVLPLVTIAAGVGVVFMYTMPSYEEVKRKQAEEAEVSRTLDNANSIVKLIGELKLQYDSFPPETLSKLQKMMPDVVEPIDVIVEVNNIARRGVILSDAVAEKEEVAVSTDPALRVTPDPYNTINASYSVSADYFNLLDFIYNLELNLRLTDINGLEFSVDNETGFIDVSVDTSTYWLNE